MPICLATILFCCRCFRPIGRRFQGDAQETFIVSWNNFHRESIKWVATVLPNFHELVDVAQQLVESHLFPVHCYCHCTNCSKWISFRTPLTGWIWFRTGRAVANSVSADSVAGCNDRYVLGTCEVLEGWGRRGEFDLKKATFGLIIVGVAYPTIEVFGSQERRFGLKSCRYQPKW